MQVNVSKLFLHLFVILLLFTAVRNLSYIYYFFILLFFFLLGINHHKKLIFFKYKYSLYYTLLYLCFALSIYSFLYVELINHHYISNIQQNISYSSLLIGVARFLLMPLTVFLFLYHLKYQDDFIEVIRVTLLCFLVAALSIILQIYIGEIHWFAGSHLRGGYIRYSSLIGSLAVFGSIVGYSIIFTFDKRIIKNPINKYLLLTLFFATGIITLTKTGIIMAILALLLIFLFELRYYFKRFVFQLISLLALVIILNIVVSQSVYLSHYINTVFNFTLGENFVFFDTNQKLINDTPNITYDFLYKRLTYFADSAISYYGSIIFLIGVGVFGGAGIFGFEGSSPHSGFLDLITIGGPIFLLTFLVIYIKIQLFFYKNINHGLNKSFFLSNILFFANMLFISGTVFQPSISILFWISFAYYMNQRKELKNHNEASESIIE